MGEEKSNIGIEVFKLHFKSTTEQLLTQLLNCNRTFFGHSVSYWLAAGPFNHPQSQNTTDLRFHKPIGAHSSSKVKSLFRIV